MPAGRELEAILLRGPGEHPVKGISRNLVYGCIVGVILGIFMITQEGLDWKYIVALMFVGNMLSFFGWGTERLWYSTVSKMMDNPFSVAAYCSRIPFWYLAGGIAYTLALLTVKKAGLLDVNDLPVKQLFNAGGKIGCMIQVPLQVMIYRKLFNGSV